jgi:ABC-type amino acid transport substrate-binding protein
MTATESKWAERVRRWKASGQTADEYAPGLGFAAGTLRWWSSRLGRRASTPAAGSPRVRMLRVVASTRSSGSLSVRVGAAHVEVRAGFDQALLREVVEALGGAS